MTHSARWCWFLFRGGWSIDLGGGVEWSEQMGGMSGLLDPLSIYLAQTFAVFKDIKSCYFDEFSVN